jgi:RNA polymerase sigma-70 factor, ECF subfamily
MPDGEPDRGEPTSGGRSRRGGGSASHLGVLLEKYKGKLERIARGRVNGPVAAGVGISGVVQQAYLRAIQGFPRFRGETENEFFAWVKRILINVISTENQRAGAQTEVLLDEVPEVRGASPSEAAIRAEQNGLLARLIDALPRDEAEAVRLRHLKGLPVKTIAEQIGRTPSATAGLIARGMKRLRDGDRGDER